MGIEFPFFNFLVCKIYLGTWARKAHGHVGHMEHVGRVGTLVTPFNRLRNQITFFLDSDICLI